MAAGERTFIPESEFSKVYRNARICVAIYGLVIALAIFGRVGFRFSCLCCRNFSAPG